MSRWLRNTAAAAFALLTLPAYGAGTLPFALQQQFSFTNCQTGTNACGTPLIGGLVYFYQAGSGFTRQDSFLDTALTIANPWPLPLDSNGRVPMFYLADGSIHVRLTDASGVPQYDNTVLVIGPSSGSGGGSTIDPTTIASTGDVKFRPTSEILTGWVRLNGLTIGSATSGATGRANSDTQALFIYLWTNCPDTHCPVVAGRGVSGLADFSANKQLTLMDWRSRTTAGLDCMGNACAARILNSNVTSGGGDTSDTSNATGGEANHLLTVGEMPSHSHTATVTDPGHQHANGFITTNATLVPGGSVGGTGVTATALTGITVANSSTGGGGTHNIMSPFVLGTWHMHL